MSRLETVGILTTDGILSLEDEFIGENRALACMVVVLKHLGLNVVVIDPSCKETYYKMGTMVCNNHTGLDLVIVHFPNRTEVVRCYAGSEDFLWNNRGKVISFNWSSNPGDVDPDFCRALIQHPKIEDFPSPRKEWPIKVFPWSPYMLDIFWKPFGSLNNVVVGFGSHNVPNEIHCFDQNSQRMIDLLQEWTKVSEQCDGWYLDIGRLSLESMNVGGILWTSHFLKNCNNVRIITGYTFKRWITYLSRSSVFVEGAYGSSSRGTLDAIYCGVPSIVHSSFNLPPNYPLIISNPVTIFEKVLEIYSEYKEGKTHTIDLCSGSVNYLRGVYGFGSVSESLGKVLKEVEHIIG